MNTKRKDSRNERRSRALLEAQGYSVTRAAASMGAFDLIAVCARHVLLVQVKSNRWPRAAEMSQMRAFCAPKNARKVIHRWRDRVPAPDVRVLE
jgi:Holliday junction resolvase